MPLLTANVSGLINGVSQQAENLRYATQVEEQDNAVPSVVSGLTPRPHTNHVAQVNLGAPPSGLVFHPINRSAEERYAVVMSDRLIRAFRPDGAEVPVRAADGSALVPGDLDYIATANPKRDLKLLTVADYTMVLNRSTVARMKPDLTPRRTPEALIFLKQFRAGMGLTIQFFENAGDTVPVTSVYANVGTKPTDDGGTMYGINIGGTTSVASNVSNQGDVIARVMMALNHIPPSQGWVFTFSEGIIYASKKDGSDFRIEVTCTVPECLYCFKDRVQAFAMLPAKAVEGFTIKVTGDPETSGDEYYIKFVADSPLYSRVSSGTWEEAQAGGLADQIDASTMPHVLKNHGTHFTFEPLSWEPRAVGDEDSNSVPSFVGNTIRNILFHRNRLGFLSGENVVMSAADGEFFRFWRKSVIQTLDDDPIDVGSAHGRISILNHAVANSEKLVLFSDQTQFVFGSSTDLLTAMAAENKPATDYEYLSSVEPRTAGNSIFFAYPRSSHTGFYDYAIDSTTNLFKGDDITEHVPSFIPGHADRIEVNAEDGMMLVSTPATPSRLYLYKFYKRGGERLQSAWGTFTFSRSILGFFFINSTLWLLFDNGGGTQSMETVDFTPNVTDAGSDRLTRLDRRLDETEVTRSYDELGDTTTISIPYTLTPGRDYLVVTRDSGEKRGGHVAQTLKQFSRSIIVRGDYSNTPLYVGEPYTMKVVLTRPALREQRQNGTVVVVPGRFQVRYGILAYDNSLAFDVKVEAHRRVSRKTFRARTLGVDSTVGRVPNLEDGAFRFPVFSRSDAVKTIITNSTPHPCALLSIDWEAMFSARTARA